MDESVDESDVVLKEHHRRSLRGPRRSIGIDESDEDIVTDNAVFQHSSRRGRQTARTIDGSADETVAENAVFQNCSRRGRETAHTIDGSAEETVAEDAAFRDSSLPEGAAHVERAVHSVGDAAFQHGSRRGRQTAQMTRNADGYTTEEEDAAFRNGSRSDEGAAVACFEGMKWPFVVRWVQMFSRWHVVWLLHRGSFV